MIFETIQYNFFLHKVGSEAGFLVRKTSAYKASNIRLYVNSCIWIILLLYCQVLIIDVTPKRFAVVFS